MPVGVEQDPNFQRFEILAHNDTDKSFEAYVVDYRESPVTLKRSDQECRRCHRYNLRPNMETYFLWPGFFGSDDDNANKSRR